MTYCSGSLYRNNSGVYNSRNTGAGCVCDNNGNCSCNNGIGGCNTCNSNTCGCGNGVGGCNTCNSNNCGCGNGVGGCNTCGCGNGNICHLPPRPSCCNTCPPGTFPCSWRPYPWYPSCNCGCNGNNGCQMSNSGSFAFLNSSGSTLNSGSIIPLRYVLGTGNLAKNTSGGSINLECGTYSVAYSLNGVTADAGTTITVTPEYGGMLHPEFSRSYTSSVGDQSFELTGLFALNTASDTTLSLNVTITGDATSDTTITAANASMLITKVGGCSN